MRVPRLTCRAIALVLATGVASSASAQREEIFGSGKPPAFREEAMDRKFNKSRFAKMLKEGTAEPACVELLGGMLTAFAEILPMLHKRDENFYLDPVLVNAVQTQLSTGEFPAVTYLQLMVRKVMIDHRVPDEWLATAEAINKTAKLIDLAKLKAANENLQLADSFLFTIPLLKERYYVEALNANSAVTTDVMASFRDTYLDRDVAWGGAFLVDVGVNQPKGKKKRYALAEPEELIAVLAWKPYDPRKTKIDLLGTLPKKVDPIIIYARLAAKQYLDVEKLFKDQRVLVKGRLWEMNRTVTEIEVREALIFKDIEWANGGVVLGSPADISQCPAAINDITGISTQVGGFRH